RLSTLIKQKGGVLAQDAIAAAERGVESLRESSLAALDQTLAEIDRRFGKDALGRQAETFDALYLLGSRIIDVGAFVSDSGVDKAAVSLCTLADDCA
ncbi:hypothetical protein VQ049_13055, partial [Staphylococcus arlettae]